MGSPLQVGSGGQLSVPSSVPDLLVEASEGFGAGDPSSGPVKLVLFDGTEYSPTGEDFTVYVHRATPAFGDRFNVRWNADSGRYEASGSSGSSNDPEFPSGGPSLDCGCGKCPEGTRMHNCTVCGCWHRTLYTKMPEVRPTFGPNAGQVWAELLEVTKLTYWEECRSRGQEIDGPPCTDEYDAEIRDKYRVIEDFEADTLELIRTVNNGCPLITLKWKRCGCPKQCNCRRQYALAEDGVNNLEVPDACKVCVTPNWPMESAPRTPRTLCGPDDCIVSLADIASIRISGAGLAFPDASNEGLGVPSDPVKKFSFDGDYQLTPGAPSGVCCGIEGEICLSWGGQGVVLPSFYMTGVGGAYRYTCTYQPGAAVVAVPGDKYKVHAFMMLSVGTEPPTGPGSFQSAQCYLSWASSALTCEELNTAAESGQISLTPTACRDNNTFQDESGSAVFTFSGGTQKRAQSTGHKGGLCGGEETTDCGYRDFEAVMFEGDLVWQYVPGANCNLGCGSADPAPPEYEGQTVRVYCTENP